MSNEFITETEEKRAAYKLIISDDEEKICALLKGSIHWEGLNLELCGICYNGLELRDMMKKEQPDILVTDICMPGMNALELIREVREEGNQVKILIVSGYRQFEYAREALKYGVDNYLLKPIDEKELNDALEKICIEMEIEQNAVQSKSADKIKATLQSFFIRDMKNGILDKEDMELQEINQKYYSDFSEGCFRVVFVKMDIADGNAEKISPKIIQEKIREKCMEAIAKVHIDTIVSFVQGGVVFTINYLPGRESEMRQLTKKMLENALETVSFFKGIHITIGVGKRYTRAADIGMSYREAEESLVFRISSKTNRIYEADSLTMRHQEHYLPEEMRKELVRSFELGDEGLFHQCFQKLTYAYVSDIYRLYKILQECILLFSESLENQRVETGDNISIEKMLYEMQQAMSVTGLLQTVEDGIRNLIGRIKEERRQRENRPVREAKEYVKKHYAEKIRLEDVASAIGFNPAYFSAMFSKEEGTTFTDFVNDYRIEMAKELLRSGNYTVAETCDMVGIGNQRYFSKLFKMKVGVKPVEYRNLYN